ncbi:MAG: 50S ribosomal protein L16 [Patescibacteria group bacterium]|jgi:large subunit ribosomal protein L16
MLMPRKVKHRKWHRAQVKGNSTQCNLLNFGDYGLKALTGAWITARQIEAARRAMTRFVQRGGRIWIRVFPHHPVTLKGGEIRMGGGKGAVDHFIAEVKPGTILFEIGGISQDQAQEALRLATHKLPVRTKFLSKNATL